MDYIVTSGGSMTDITLHSGDSLTVEAGGSAVDIIVSSGASMVVAGGAAISTTVMAGAEDDLFAGATATGTLLSGGNEVVNSGAVASATIVSGSGSVQYVFSGGTVSDTDLLDGGELTVYAGGSAVGTVSNGMAVGSGGTVTVSSGGSATSAGSYYGAEPPPYGTTMTVLQDDSGNIVGWATVNPDGSVTVNLYGKDPVTLDEPAGFRFGAGSTIVLLNPVNNEFLDFTDNTLTCFLAGTAIRTPAGDVPVETLRPGDPVRLADGRVLPVRWVGRQTVSRAGDPLRTWPVRIRAGALGNALPARDLLLSPGHALLLGGFLVQAGALVDGAGIVREAAMPDRFTYWHVELAEHALLLAEGVAAESYLPGTADVRFDNRATRPAPPRPAEELPFPRIKSERQLPPTLRPRRAA